MLGRQKQAVNQVMAAILEITAGTSLGCGPNDRTSKMQKERETRGFTRARRTFMALAELPHLLN
jgi:hypothetical protein